LKIEFFFTKHVLYYSYRTNCVVARTVLGHRFFQYCCLRVYFINCVLNTIRHSINDEYFSLYTLAFPVLYSPLHINALSTRLVSIVQHSKYPFSVRDVVRYFEYPRVRARNIRDYRVTSARFLVFSRLYVKAIAQYRATPYYGLFAFSGRTANTESLPRAVNLSREKVI